VKDPNIQVISGQRAWVLPNFMPFSFYPTFSVTISPFAVALALLFSGVVGTFFGVYPAFKASSLDPIEALRHE
jgi:ABC-type antimicrobial peptide transport system permease subunit